MDIEQRRLSNFLSAFWWTSLSLIGANDSDNSGTGSSVVCLSLLPPLSIETPTVHATDPENVRMTVSDSLHSLPECDGSAR